MRSIKSKLLQKAVTAVATFAMAVQPVLASYRFQVPLEPQEVVTTGMLSFSASAIDFGSVPVGTVVTRTLNIANVGTDAVTLDNVSASGAGFSQINDCPASLTPGAACDVTVRYHAASGAATGALAVRSSDAQAVQSIPLAGRGLAGTLAGQGHTFTPAQQVGAELVYHDIVITNVGSASVQIAAVSVVGLTPADDASFSQSNNCSGALTSNSQCLVRVGFSPATAGQRSAEVVLVSDSEQSPLRLGVAGVGVAPSGTLSVEPFGEAQIGSTVSRTVTLLNTGVGPLVVQGVAITGDAYRESTSGGRDSCVSSIPVGGSCTFSVDFTPTTAGSQVGQASATTSAGTLTAELTGSGRSPEAELVMAAFSATAVGSVSTAVGTLTNRGVDAITLQVPSVTGEGFTLDSTSCGSLLLPEQACTVTVSFGPSSAGTKSGTLSITTQAGPKTATLSALAQAATLQMSPATAQNFGTRQVGSTTNGTAITVTNAGNVAAQSLSISVPSGFSIASGSTCATGMDLAAGASCTLVPRFAPSATTAYSGNITVSTSSGAGSSVSVSVSGSAQPASASLTDVSFGALAAGSGAVQGQATLTNTGVGTLSLTAPTSSSVTGDSAFSFGSTNCGSSLASGASCVITVNFTPTGNAAYNGTLTVQSATVGSLAATLSGSSQAPQLSVSPTTLSAFGSVQVGATATSTALTLTNTGALAASNLAITLPAGYSKASGTCTAGGTLAPNSSCTFAVLFSPVAVASYSGNLTFSTAAATGSSVDVALSGSGVAQNATLSNIEFGNRDVDSTADLTATLTNTGVGTLTVNAAGATVSGAGFSKVGTTCGSTLAAGQNCTFTVRFSPTAVQSYSGALTVSTGAGEKTATLTGAGQKAVLVFEPAAALDFGNVQVGQTASSSQITLRNSGNRAAGSLSVNVPANFALSGSTCATSLASGDTCTFTVTFSPSAAASYSGTISASGSGAVTAASKAVSGTGVAQAGSLSSGTWSAGVPVGSTANHTVVLSNTGVGPLTVVVPTNASVTGTDFSFGSTTCTTSLAQSASCNIVLRATPSASGSRSGTLTVQAGGSTLTANLSVTGQSPAFTLSPAGAFTLGTVQVGETAQSVVRTLTNTGNLDATGLTLTAPTGFTVQASSCGSTLAAGANCTFRLEFAPQAAQSYNGNFVASADTPAQPLTLAVSGTGVNQTATVTDIVFGDRAVNSTTDLTSTLTNTGHGPLSVTVPTSASVTGSEFSFVSTTCTNSVAVAGSCTVTVRFTSASRANYSGTLTVQTGAGALTAELSGRGVQGTGVANPTSLTFADTQVGQTSAYQAVTVTNNGNQPLTITGVSIASGTADYGQNNNCGATLAVGTSCTINVAFTPSTTGSRPGTLAMTHDGPGGVTTVSLSGTGASATATLSDISFGSVAQGTSSDQTATLTNTGVGPLTLTVPGASTVTGTDFAFTQTNCEATLAAGASCTVTVRFSPTSNVQRTGTLVVQTAAGALTSALQGTGLRAALSVTPTGAYAFGNVQTGKSATSSAFTVTNTGNATASSLTIAPPTGYTVVSNGCGASLAAAATCQFSVAFSPVAAQAYNGDVTVTASSVGGSVTASKALTGTGVASSATLSVPAFSDTQVGDTSTATATLTNTGIDSISVTAPAAANVTGTNFSLSGHNCPTTLAAGASCTVTVSFSPSAAATRTGNLSVTTGAGVKSAALSAIGRAPSYTITDADLGANFAPRTRSGGYVRLTNTGVGDIVFSAAPTVSAGWVVSTNAGSSSFCLTKGTVTPGTVCILGTVYEDNQPAGSYSGTLTAPSSAGDITATVSATVKGDFTASNTSFGTVQIGSTSSRTITVTNSADYAVQGFSATTAAPYSITSTTCGATLAAGGTCTVTVRFSPTASGAANGALTLTGNYMRIINGAESTNAGQTYSNNVTLSGTATAPALSLSRTSYAFGTQTRNTNTDSPLITLSNTGTASATALAIVAPTGFSLVNNNCTTTLAAGASCTFNVRFTPTLSQAYSDTVDISAAAPSNSLSLAVTGTGVAAATISNASFDDESITVGGTRTFTWATTGASSASVSCSGLSVAGTPSGTSGSVTVTAGSTAGQTNSCTVTALNSAGDTVTRSDTVTVVAAPSVSSGAFNATRITVGGNSKTFSWSTANAASATVACTGLTVTGTASGLSGNITVNAGGAVGANVSCTVTARNAAGTTATLTDTMTTVAAPVVNTAQFSHANITASQSQGRTFSWTTTGATSVSASCSRVTLGATSAVDGSTTVTAGSATGTATCTLTGTNAAGDTATRSDTISVIAAPTASATLSAASVVTGGSVTLTWSSGSATTAAVSCTGAGVDFTSTALSGTQSLATTVGGTLSCTVTSTNAAGATATATDTAPVASVGKFDLQSVTPLSNTSAVATFVNLTGGNLTVSTRFCNSVYGCNVFASSTCQAGLVVPPNGTCTVAGSGTNPTTCPGWLTLSVSTAVGSTGGGKSIPPDPDGLMCN